MPLLSLVLSVGNNHDVQVGAVDPGLEDHDVQVDTIGERGGQASLGHHQLPDSLHEGQTVFLATISSPGFPVQQDLQRLAHNTLGKKSSRWWNFNHWVKC